MLAFSAREALRDAVAAFGPKSYSVELASPATPEAVFWALQDSRNAMVGAKEDPGPNGMAVQSAIVGSQG